MYVPLTAPRKDFSLFGCSAETRKQRHRSNQQLLKNNDATVLSPSNSPQHNVILEVSSNSDDDQSEMN